MSECISHEGEYSEHLLRGKTLGSEFVCARCLAYDEDAADREIASLRDQVADAWDMGYGCAYLFERGEVYPEPRNPFRPPAPPVRDHAADTEGPR